jgi:hypothetical protein
MRSCVPKMQFARKRWDMRGNWPQPRKQRKSTDFLCFPTTLVWPTAVGACRPMSQCRCRLSAQTALPSHLNPLHLCRKGSGYNLRPSSIDLPRLTECRMDYTSSRPWTGSHWHAIPLHCLSLPLLLLHRQPFKLHLWVGETTDIPPVPAVLSGR